MTPGQELVKAEEYAALAMPTEDLATVIEENLAGQQISEFDLDRIKMPAGGGTTWEVPTLEGTDAVKELEGIIVYWKEGRSFWATKYTGGSEPPDCSSPDAQFATGDPGVAVPTDEHERFICAQCPNAEFGTAVNDDGERGPGQACKLQRQIFLLTPTSLLPLVVSLPPSSVANSKKYLLRLAGAGKPYSGVITKISLTAEKSQGGIKYSAAEFSVGTILEGEEAAKVKEFAAKLRPSLERVEVRADEVPDGGVEI